MALPPLVEMPVNEAPLPKKVAMSFKVDPGTVHRLKAVREAGKRCGVKQLNIDPHFEEKIHDLLDTIEIELSEHGHQLDEKLLRKKEARIAAAGKRKAKKSAGGDQTVSSLESASGGEYTNPLLRR